VTPDKSAPEATVRKQADTKLRHRWLSSRPYADLQCEEGVVVVACPVRGSRVTLFYVKAHLCQGALSSLNTEGPFDAALRFTSQMVP